jgi:hypothetical protein
MSSKLNLKLSRKQGQILVKLIHRQTGTTTYESWSKSQKWLESFLVNTAASMFDILKTKYAPFDVNEDYLIETILVRAFDSGRLQNQNPAKPVDYDNLTDTWESRAEKLKSNFFWLPPYIYRNDYRKG